MNLLSRILPSLALAAVSSVGVAQGTSRPAPTRPVAQASDAQPAAATARCRDGSFTTDGSAGRCAANGGVLVSFPARGVPPAPARPSIAAPSSVAGVVESPAARRPSSSAPSALSAAELATPVRAAPSSAGVPARAPRAAAVRAVESRDVPKPSGATAQCKDGTFTTGLTSPATCSGNGGIAVLLPAERKSLPVSAPANNQRKP